MLVSWDTFEVSYVSNRIQGSVLAEDSSTTRCRRMGASVGNTAGAGSVEAAAPANDDNTGVTTLLTSGGATLRGCISIAILEVKA
jgi:acetyl-CoA carboxylase beta subunit